jgi:asparagine synthase (glutamine-hydrolysing)
MCGIVGFVDQGLDRRQLEPTLIKMREKLLHRGPDDAGSWLDEERGIALGFRRLSILDLSPTGHQPMESPCGRFVIVFNGEIYNHVSLRSELEKRSPEYMVQLKGHSDTSVLLSGIAVWGLEKTLSCAVGMFAFALWDREEQTLTLARDRVGEKPLYYGKSGQALLFASELKALTAFSGFSPPIDRRALTLFMRHNYIPAPYSIYTGIHKLPPGHFLKIAYKDISHSALSDFPPTSYWDFKDVAEKGMTKPFDGSEEEALQNLEKVLSESVRLQMVADVPVGVFLSGGIDSSMLVALMARQSPGKVKTFSIGFSESGFDEAPYAREVAKHLGTDHHEMYVTSEMALSLVPRLPEIFDEPFADSSQIPTYFVSEFAKRHVTVSLSGDGADELFGGYSRYFDSLALADKLDRVPSVFRGLLGRGIGQLPAVGSRMTNGRLEKLAQILSEESFEEVYRGIVSHWLHPEEVVREGSEPPYRFTENATWPAAGGRLSRMQFLDAVTYLPDDILVKVDRASMAVSLESRAPYLDHRVIGFAWRLPESLRTKNGKGKYLLRQLLSRHVPEALFERPKMGFGVPVGDWLRGPLRDWAEDLLNEKKLQDEGYFNPKEIRQKWKQHLEGSHQWHYPLWNVLTFQAWRRTL